MFRVTNETCAGCAVADLGFCANLSGAAIERIARFSKPVRFAKRQQIRRDDSPPMSALVLRSGMIKVSNTLADGRQQVIDFLAVGDILVHDGIDAAEATIIEATTDVDACEIDLRQLNAVCADAPDLDQTLLTTVLAEIARKNQQVMMLGRKRSDERVATFLLDFSNRAMRRGAPPEHLRLPMSRSEIADYLSLTTETVSRAFSLLKEEGIVHMPKPHQVVIRDLAGLLEIAHGGGNLSVR